MKKFLIGLSILGLTNLAYPHNNEGGESYKVKGGIHLPPGNQVYFRLAQQSSAAGRVVGLQKIAAEFDVKKSQFFEPGTKTYEITFEKGSGKIQAMYDREGNIRRTFEKYDNVSLPAPVRNTIWRDYKGCNIEKNTYQISYSESKITKAVYKVWIERDGLKKRLKLDAGGRLI